MTLKDRIAEDNSRVFLNPDHFAETHTWNGRSFLCVTDDEMAMKRKNNNVNDISWDNNTAETMVYTRVSDFPGRAQPNDQGFFDRKPMKILQVQEDAGMYSILLSACEPREVAL
ncbi:MAG: hypothetical protein LLF96_01295 [Eubacteriales bacterium]|nr:hypothetical protein [Eubacteriales bacterium]